MFLVEKGSRGAEDFTSMRHYDDIMHAYLCGRVSRDHLIQRLGAPPPRHKHVERSVDDRFVGGPELSRDFDDRICGRCGLRRCDHPPSDVCHGMREEVKFTDNSVDGTWPVWVTPEEAQCLLPGLALATRHDALSRRLWNLSRTTRVSMELEDVRYFLNMMHGSTVANFPEAQALIVKLADAKTQLGISLLREIYNLPEGYDLRCEDGPGEGHELRVRGYRPVHTGHPFWQGILRSWVLAGNEAQSHVRLTAKADDLLFHESSWVAVNQLVGPHPVGRVQCNDCEGTGKRTLFRFLEDCDACEGTGWMGGKIKSSSENAMGGGTGEGATPRK